MAVIHCIRYLCEGSYLVLLSQLFVMIVEVVEKGHLHKVSYDANISVIREIIMKFNDIRMVDRLKNSRLLLRTIYLILIHFAFLEDFDRKVSASRALLHFFHSRRQATTKFVQNFVLILDRHFWVLKEFTVNLKHVLLNLIN